MSYFVVVTFDIEDQTSTIYTKIAERLNSMGLYQFVIGSLKKPSDLPANTFAGEFNGESSFKIRDDVANRVLEIINNVGAKGKVFVSVGDSWAWGIRST